MDSTHAGGASIIVCYTCMCCQVGLPRRIARGRSLDHVAGNQPRIARQQQVNCAWIRADLRQAYNQERCVRVDSGSTLQKKRIFSRQRLQSSKGATSSSHLAWSNVMGKKLMSFARCLVVSMPLTSSTRCFFTSSRMPPSNPYLNDVIFDNRRVRSVG